MLNKKDDGGYFWSSLWFGCLFFGIVFMIVGCMETFMFTMLWIGCGLIVISFLILIFCPKSPEMKT